jgi:acyl carrier protein
MQTLELLRDYLQRKASIEPQKVTPEARLEELGIDSLMLIDLMFELEESLNVRLPDMESRPATVAELIRIFDSLPAPALKTGT